MNNICFFIPKKIEKGVGKLITKLDKLDLDFIEKSDRLIVSRKSSPVFEIRYYDNSESEIVYGLGYRNIFLNKF